MGTHTAPGPDADGERLGDDHRPNRAAAARPVRVWTRWRGQVRGDRRFQAICAVVAVVALVIAAVGFVAGRQSRAEPEPRDHIAVQAAADAVAELMTFAPDDTPRRRSAVAGQLTGTLAADYAARGPDVVFPNAVASKISMKTTVSSAALDQQHGDIARVLLFATQEIVVGEQQDYPTRTGIARWAGITKVDGVWRLSRMENVSPQ